MGFCECGNEPEREYFWPGEQLSTFQSDPAPQKLVMFIDLG